MKSLAVLTMILLSLGACKKNNEPEPPMPPAVQEGEERSLKDERWVGDFWYEDNTGVENKIFSDIKARKNKAKLFLSATGEGWCKAYIVVEALKEDGETYGTVKYNYGFIRSVTKVLASTGHTKMLKIDMSNVKPTVAGYALLKAVDGEWIVRNATETSSLLDMRRDGDPLVDNIQYLRLEYFGGHVDDPSGDNPYY